MKVEPYLSIRQVDVVSICVTFVILSIFLEKFSYSYPPYLTIIAYCYIINSKYSSTLSTGGDTMGKQRSCTNCKSKNLEPSNLLQGASASCGLFRHVAMYVCKDCGHIELYKIEYSDTSIKKRNYTFD